MEYQQKILLAVTALLVVFAIYIAFTTVPVKPPDTTGARNLLAKAVVFGMGEKEYAYTFSEDSNGYRTTYSLVKGPDDMMMTVQNPLSVKRAFFLRNDTILCVRYPASANETCGSVQGSDTVANYMSSLKYKFLNDTITQRNEMDMNYLLKKGYIQLDTAVTKTAVNGKGCSEITYSLDMSNVSVDEAARFGVGPTTPRSFSWMMCIDNGTGILYAKEFNYTYKGMDYRTTIQTISFKAGSAPAIVPPAAIDGDPVTKLFQEREQQVKLASCFTDHSGDDRDKCAADIALTLRRSDICSLAGVRKDRCLVSLVPSTKDQGTCTVISDPSYKDDCYIELAGAYKDKAYCANVKNQSKIASCEAAAKPPEVQPVPPANETDQTLGNQTNQTNGSKIDINEFMNYIDKQGRNDTNATAANSSG